VDVDSWKVVPPAEHTIRVPEYNRHIGAKIAWMKRRLGQSALVCPRCAFVDQQPSAEKPALRSDWSCLDEIEALLHEDFLDHRGITYEVCARAAESQRADRTMLIRCAGEKIERISCESPEISGDHAT
jgi:hypothetical protein